MDSGPQTEQERWLPLALALAIAGATIAVYARALGLGFVLLDDPGYVLSNPIVRAGLTPSGAAWAFTTVAMANWHPIAWLSHMADVQIYGLDPAGHHATNVVLHTANALVLFAALRALTGSVWRSALVAALFALHPLRVESVAWVAQRKDVLSALFGLGALWAYVRYARSPDARRYAAVSVLFGLGLLAKASLVALPFLFLLIDRWPLERWGGESRRRLVVEKLPWLALSLAVGIVTWLAQGRSGAFLAAHEVSFLLRVSNALVSYVRYVGWTFWPVDLAVLHPHPDLPGGTPWEPWQIGVSALALVLVSAGTLRASARGYLQVGWLWFAGMLLPVIGLVQVGEQALAERYTYLPQIGLLIALVWGVSDASRRPGVRAVLVGLSLVAVCTLGLASRAQIAHWRDSIALCTRTLDVAGGSPLIHQTLAMAFDERGRDDEAVHQYRLALALDDALPESHYNLAHKLAGRGELDQAIEHYRAAIGARPQFAPAYNNLGLVLRARGEHDAAIAAFRSAVAADDGMAPAYYNLGMTLLHVDRAADAIEPLRAVLALRPDRADVYYSLARAEYQTGHPAAAAARLRSALALRPDWPEARALLEALEARGTTPGERTP